MKAKLIIPEELNEITLEQYIKFLALDSEDKEYHIKVIQTLCDGDVKFIKQFPLKVIKEAAEQLEKVIKATDQKKINIIKIDGVEYGLHPKMDELTVAEFADLETYQEEFWNNIHKILAILYRPINQKSFGLYNIEPYEGTQNRPELFLKKFPLVALQGFLVFFSTIANELPNDLNLFLKAQSQDSSKKPIGDGTGLFKRFAKMIFLKSMKSKKSQSQKH